jgi:hypothetical protein
VLVANLPRRRLGAEELLELGTPISTGTVVPTVKSVSPVAESPPECAPPAPSRTVLVSRAEGQLLIKVVENIISFKDSFVIEFISYCPPDRWQTTLTHVGTWVQEIERQINAGHQQIAVPAEAVFRLVDLEKCISAARDARLDSARWAFGLTAGATIVSTLLGWKWVSIPAYIAGLAILFGRPLMAKYYPEPQDPYQPILSGARPRFSLGAGCAAPKESEADKKRVKLIERVILPPEPGLKSYYWGEVDCAGMGPQSSICLEKGRFRIRVEGYAADIVRPINGWKFCKTCDDAINVIGVWDVDGYRNTSFGPVPEKSIHLETYFVEYVGPNTGGKVRRAGPFGCPMDTRDHGIEDGGITKLGIDGDVAMFDGEGNPVPVPPLER